MITPGTSLGPYEVIASIGAGGMGEVYRARDSRLARDVALKTLPERVATDPERLARFEREARVLAGLNHTNIAALYGIEGSAADGTGPVLVMEFVDGPTLSDRIAQGAMPLDEALPIAREIAAGLEAAHAHGIVHRDLKPANIKLRPDGTVKILDFGLAKAIAAPGSAGDAPELAHSPTITSPAMTQAGMILGTAAYMAPEQARGRPVDKRADIWAFGCVLYEMLTGRRPFGGDDLTLTLAAIVKDAPDVSAVPASARRLIAKCLEKDPRQRLRDIGDAFELIDDARAAPREATPPARATWLPWSVAAAAMLVAAAVAARSWFAVPVSDAVVRFEVEWPRQTQGTGSVGYNFFEVSPDGRYFAIASDGVLWVRGVDQVRPVRIDHTDGAVYSFWSPDSQSIGFFADGELKRVDRTGGQVQRICAAGAARGGAWNTDGTIIFAADEGIPGLSRVSASGGAVTTATTIAKPRTSSAHRYPHFLPDEQRFLFLYLDGSPDVGGVYVGSLDGAPAVRVLAGAWRAVFVPNDSGGAGHLVVVQDTALMAIPFDPRILRVSGAPISVADRVSAAQNTGLGRFSVSPGGVLAHGELSKPASEFAWFDRQGNRLSREAPANPGNVESIEFDRDERRAALVIIEQSGQQNNIWLSLEPGMPASKFTLGGPPGWFSPRWSPDGLTIAYTTNSTIGLPLYELRCKTVESPHREEVLLNGDEPIWVWDVFPDASALLFALGRDLWRLPLAAPRTPVRLTQSVVDERWPQVSPNGRWIAYATAEQGTDQVFVQSVSSMSERWLITPAGGTMPRWSRDGEALYYRAPDSRLRRVTVRGAAPVDRSAVFEHRQVETLALSVPSSSNFALTHTYYPSADGLSFLVLKSAEGRWPPMTVVLNWQAGLRR